MIELVYTCERCGGEDRTPVGVVIDTLVCGPVGWRRAVFTSTGPNPEVEEKLYCKACFAYATSRVPESAPQGYR